MWRAAIVSGFAAALVSAAVACTIVYTPTPREAMRTATVVFRGTVVNSQELRQHPEMRGRKRYAVTLRATEYWKGDRGESVVLYDLDPGTDCLGFGLRVGKEYLIFAKEEAAADVRYAADDFAVGWTDVLAPGTPMLKPETNVPGGDLSDLSVRRSMRQLGSGRKLPK
jgi:hypothetical protein